MNVRVLLLFVVLIGLLSFKIITAKPPKNLTPFPVNRTIEDVQGRKIDVAILAKRNDQVIVEKRSDTSRFIIPVSRLSSEDQEFLGKFGDSYDFSYWQKIITKQDKTKNRRAIWHKVMENAKREAQKYDLPIVMVFLSSQGAASKEISLYNLESREFRQWANDNAVLCLFYKEANMSGSANFGGSLDLSAGLNALEAEQGRSMASKMGVSKTPVLIITNSKGVRRDSYTFPEKASPDEVIRDLDRLIRQKPPTPPLQDISPLDRINYVFYKIKSAILSLIGK